MRELHDLSMKIITSSHRVENGDDTMNRILEFLLSIEIK